MAVPAVNAPQRPRRIEMFFRLSPNAVSAPQWSCPLVAVPCLISFSKVTYSWKQTSEPVRFTFKMEFIDSDKTQKVFSARKLHVVYARSPQCIVS